MAVSKKAASAKKNISPEKSTKPSEPESVNAYMETLQHPLKNLATAIRDIILSADRTIGEEICWNAPFFFYTGAMKPFNPKEYKRFVVGFNFFKKVASGLYF